MSSEHDEDVGEYITDLRVENVPPTIVMDPELHKAYLKEVVSHTLGANNIDNLDIA